MDSIRQSRCAHLTQRWTTGFGPRIDTRDYVPTTPTFTLDKPSFVTVVSRPQSPQKKHTHTRETSSYSFILSIYDIPTYWLQRFARLENNHGNWHGLSTPRAEMLKINTEWVRKQASKKTNRQSTVTQTAVRRGRKYRAWRRRTRLLQ